MKILIVDDSKVTLNILKKSLDSFGDEIVLVTNGDDAWEVILQGEVRLVITDWMMPGLSGIELIKKVRQANFKHYIYMVLVTARSKKDDIIAGLNAGADDYFTKPFNPPELRARVSIARRILNYQKRLQETQDRLHDLATHDSLTGLLNRRALYERIESEMKRAQHAAWALSLLLLDLDHFKQVNDTYGHLIGDRMLCLVADTVTKSVRPYDWVGRWGGEEFLVVMRETERKDALKVAERVRKNVAQAQLEIANDEKHFVQIHVSGGVTAFDTFSQEDCEIDELLQQADTALYLAKEKGRNQICVFEVE